MASFGASAWRDPRRSYNFVLVLLSTSALACLAEAQSCPFNCECNPSCDCDPVGWGCYEPLLCKKTSECACKEGAVAACGLCPRDGGSRMQFEKVCHCYDSRAMEGGVECMPKKPYGPFLVSSVPIGVGSENSTVQPTTSIGNVSASDIGESGEVIKDRRSSRNETTTGEAADSAEKRKSDTSRASEDDKGGLSLAAIAVLSALGVLALSSVGVWVFCCCYRRQDRGTFSGKGSALAVDASTMHGSPVERERDTWAGIPRSVADSSGDRYRPGGERSNRASQNPNAEATLPRRPLLIAHRHGLDREQPHPPLPPLQSIRQTSGLQYSGSQNDVYDPVFL